MAEMLVVVSKVKDAVKAAGCNVGGDFPEALSAHVEEQIKLAVKRAEANGRKTVRASDL
jgi:histone H3/H4